jgi:hypothetical protein
MAEGSIIVERDEIRVKGRRVEVPSIRIDGKVIIITGRLVRTARMMEEWYDDVVDPARIIKGLEGRRAGVDIFTFWQRLPDTEPRFSYYTEWDNVAALAITSFDRWWKEQVNAKTRNLVRRAEKKGVAVREVPFNDELVRGIVDIFNETPVRQGKPFWHYKKDFEIVKQEMSDRLEKADFIGAYYNNELIGFIKLLHAGKYSDMVEILSKIEHRDKSPTNALLAKAVQMCERKKVPYLVYANWARGSLGEFKRHNGFEKMHLPRYYVPLTIKGRICLKLRLHHGLVGVVPEKAKVHLIDLRAKWYSRKGQLGRRDV